MGQQISKRTRNKGKRRRLTALPSPPSRFEDRIATHLTNHGIQFWRQQRIGWWCADFRLYDGTVIEANGCYFHGCPCRKGVWSKGVAERRSRDKALATYCRKRKIRLITVWECQDLSSALAFLTA